MHSTAPRLFLTLLCATSLCAQGPAEKEIRESAAKAVALLQQSCQQVARVQTCFSCHHAGLPAIALQRARQHGVPVDEKAAREVSLKAFASPDTENLVSLDLAIQGPLLIDPGMGGTGLTLIAGRAAGLKSSLVTAVHAMRAANWQSDDGTWPTVDSRPPSSHSIFTNTAIAARAIDLHMPKQLEAKKRLVLQRARHWFEKAQPKTTEDFTFHLFGLKWTGADSAKLREAADQLLALRQDDGGWAQIRSRSTDAYATAEALVALHEAGGIPVDNPVWRRGIKYLLDNQKSDGSWLVQTRQVSPAPISPPYYETGYPHEKHQFISASAASWAIMALSYALPPASSPAEPLPLPELSPTGVEAWMETALFGTAEELSRLLNNGLDPNSATPEGTTLLMAASTNADMIALLTEAGANVNAKAKSGFTALHAAASHRGSARAVRVLLDAGAEVEPGRDVMFNASPLSLAAYVGDRRSTAMLKAAGGDPDRPFLLIGKILVTPAVSAVFNGHTDLFRDLVRGGADPNEDDSEGMSLLSWAVVGNRLDLVEALLDLEANINHVDKFGYTPALYAATIDHGDTEILELLIERGADLTIVNKKGQTALSNARRFGYPEIVRILETSEKL